MQYTSRQLFVAALLIFLLGYNFSARYDSVTSAIQSERHSELMKLQNKLIRGQQSLKSRLKGVGISSESVDDDSIQAEVTQCKPVSDEDRKFLKDEIRDYEKSSKFQDKIREAEKKVPLGAHHLSIERYLKENVLAPGYSVLDLGCAAGIMLRTVYEAYGAGTRLGPPSKNFVGVELVTGWVKFANEYSFYKDKIKIYKGDTTEFTLPTPQTFDLVMLNDVLEHLQKGRYGCFFDRLEEVTHDGSIVYFHVPMPQAQLSDTGQFVENVLPHHYVIMGMALKGFELVDFSLDKHTDCGKPGTSPKYLEGTKCMYNGFTKYYHALFRRTSKKVFDLN